MTGIATGAPEALCPDPPYPGSVLWPCGGCQQPTWAGPRIQQAVANGSAFYCFECVVRAAAKEGKELRVRPLSQLQSQPLQRALDRLHRQ